jgi:hypothetical protein
MFKYEYLVAYWHDGGSGRACLKTNKPITSASRAIQAEAAIADQAGFSAISIFGFQLLSRRLDLQAIKEAWGRLWR